MKFYILLVGSLLSVSIPSSGAGFPAQAKLPALVGIRAADDRASENTNDTGTFVLQRKLNTRTPLVVFYRIGGTAANGVDYDELTGSVQFAAGQSSATVVVRPIDDSLFEQRERVTLRLLPPASSGRDAPYRIVGGASATIVIRDNDPAPGDIALSPEATGTVGRWMEMAQQPDVVRPGTLQSTYFKTTAENREFRRAFLEFEIPDLPRGIASATLLLADGSAVISAPVAPDLHELSAYPADLAITVSDYDRQTVAITTFETDANDHEETFALDVTGIVRTFQGQKLGFRIKLAVDPAYSGGGSLGAGFQETVQGRPPRLVIRPR